MHKLLSSIISGAGVLELAIALTATSMLCAVLLILLIALAASKNFRTVFFRDGQPLEDTRRRRPQSSQPQQQTEPEPLQTPTVDPMPALQSSQPQAEQAAAGENATKPNKPHKRRKSTDDVPEFLDEIPTVPLGAGAVRKSIAPRERHAAKQVDDVPGPTYVTRPITITRAPTEGTNSAQKSHTPKSGKKSK